MGLVSELGGQRKSTMKQLFLLKLKTDHLQLAMLVLFHGCQISWFPTLRVQNAKHVKRLVSSSWTSPKPFPLFRCLCCCSSRARSRTLANISAWQGGKVYIEVDQSFLLWIWKDLNDQVISSDGFGRRLGPCRDTSGCQDCKASRDQQVTIAWRKPVIQQRVCTVYSIHCHSIYIYIYVHTQKVQANFSIVEGILSWSIQKTILGMVPCVCVDVCLYVSVRMCVCFMFVCRLCISKWMWNIDMIYVYVKVYIYITGIWYVCTCVCVCRCSYMYMSMKCLCNVYAMSI